MEFGITIPLQRQLKIPAPFYEMCIRDRIRYSLTDLWLSGLSTADQAAADQAAADQAAADSTN